MSKTEEKGVSDLANVPPSLAELLQDQSVQRMIASAMGEIVRSSRIPESASVIPERPAPISQLQTARGTGWAKDIRLEPPCGEAALRRLDEGVNALLGPVVKPKPQD
jgi:hypothetical protein